MPFKFSTYWKILLIDFIFFNIFVSFKYSFLPFPSTPLHDPNPPHLPPLFPTPLVIVQVSFVIVPVNLSSFSPIIPSPLPSGHCQPVLNFSWLQKKIKEADLVKPDPSNFFIGNPMKNPGKLWCYKKNSLPLRAVLTTGAPPPLVSLAGFVTFPIKRTISTGVTDDVYITMFHKIFFLSTHSNCYSSTFLSQEN